MNLPRFGIGGIILLSVGGLSNAESQERDALLKALYQMHVVEIFGEPRAAATCSGRSFLSEVADGGC
jgi:hypothetical protein